MPDAIGSFHHPQMGTGDSHRRTNGYHDARSKTSQYPPMSQQDAVAMTLRLRALGCLIEQYVNRQNKSR